MPAVKYETKRVLTNNLRVGDRIDYFDSKKLCEVSIPIITVDAVCDPVIVRLGGRYKGKVAAFGFRTRIRIKRKVKG